MLQIEFFDAQYATGEPGEQSDCGCCYCARCRQRDGLTGVDAQSSPRQRLDRGSRDKADSCDRDVGSKCEACTLSQCGGHPPGITHGLRLVWQMATGQQRAWRSTALSGGGASSIAPRIQRRAPPLHAEPGTPDGVDGVGGSADLDSCRVLTTEQIEQQLARRSSDANRGLPAPGSYGVGRPRPLEFEPCAA